MPIATPTRMMTFVTMSAIGVTCPASQVPASASTIVSAAPSTGMSALTRLPKNTSSTKRATGRTIISANARSSSTIGSRSCPSAGSPPTSTSGPPGDATASRMAGTDAIAAVSSSGRRRVA